MKIVRKISELRQHVQEAKAQGHKVAFVPTMGNLHEGHLSLIDEAKQHAEFVVSSIFVNPMQFGENEDLDAYPRTFEADSSALEQRGCDLLFAPTVSEMYPNGLEAETKVDVPSLGDYHCGASRPGHFTGVSTVVTKLFNMVQPDVAVFGQKDYQQLAIIRKMTGDLCLPIKIIGMPTSRESNGLARSSRNGYLTNEQRAQASKISQILNKAANELINGSTDFESIREACIAELETEGFQPDYVNIANAESLKPAKADDKYVVILLAAFLGTTRLIDNIEVEL